MVFSGYFSTLVFETGLSRNQEQLEEKAQEGVKYEIQEMMMIRGSEGVHTSRHRDETVGEDAESHPTRANNLKKFDSCSFTTENDAVYDVLEQELSPVIRNIELPTLHHHWSP